LNFISLFQEEGKLKCVTKDKQPFKKGKTEEAVNSSSNGELTINPVAAVAQEVKVEVVQEEVLPPKRRGRPSKKLLELMEHNKTELKLEPTTPRPRDNNQQQAGPSSAATKPKATKKKAKKSVTMTIKAPETPFKLSGRGTNSRPKFTPPPSPTTSMPEENVRYFNNFVQLLFLFKY
jgi:hypothetical protein